MKLIFVCSGNTCRSPLAVAAWRALPDAPALEVSSAGLHAHSGAPMSAHALRIARDEWGVDLSWHRARALSVGLRRSADIIAVMTPDQREVLRRDDNVEGRVVLLGQYDGSPSAPAFFGPSENSGEIFDPFGGSHEAYHSCAAQIQRAVAALARELANEIEATRA